MVEGIDNLGGGTNPETVKTPQYLRQAAVVLAGSLALGLGAPSAAANEAALNPGNPENHPRDQLFIRTDIAFKHVLSESSRLQKSHTPGVYKEPVIFNGKKANLFVVSRPDGYVGKLKTYTQIISITFQSKHIPSVTAIYKGAYSPNFDQNQQFGSVESLQINDSKPDDYMFTILKYDSKGVNKELTSYEKDGLTNIYWKKDGTPAVATYKQITKVFNGYTDNLSQTISKAAKQAGS